MSLPKNASVRLKDKATEICFGWEKFDGDDCFAIHHITVKEKDNVRQFDFGPCAVRGLKKLKKFFEQKSEVTVSSGFRNPDIRNYGLSRSGNSMSLTISFEASKINAGFKLEQPEIILDCHFLDEY